MRLPITLLVLAAIGRVAESRLPSASTTTDDNKTSKRELYEGNYGLRNGVSYDTKYGVGPGVEYTDDPKEDDDPGKSSNHRFFSTPLPQIAKISDVLTGQGPPFEVALADHLFSPVSAYQARFSQPTSFAVPSTENHRDHSSLEYAEPKQYEQNQYVDDQYQQKSQNQQDKHPGYTYKKPVPEYSRADSKLLHLETAFPHLEPSRSTPAPIFPQDVILHRRPEPIEPQFYPQYSFQQFEQIPLRISDGSLQPIQYLQQSLYKLVPVQPGIEYAEKEEDEPEANEENDKESKRDQDNEPDENPKAFQVAPLASIQNNNNQQQEVAHYESSHQNQPGAPSQQYLPVQPAEQVLVGHQQEQYQQATFQPPAPQPSQEVVQIGQQDNQYQQYAQQYQSQQQPAPVLTEHQLVQISQTQRPPAGQLLHLQHPELPEQRQEPLPTQSTLSTLHTLDPISTTVSTLEPYSEISTTPKPFTESIQTTTVTPYTTHKPLRPFRPYSRLQPVSKPLPYPRPFSNTQPTTLAPLSPLPTFRRYPHLQTRHTTPSTISITFSSQPTDASSQSNPTEILSSQSYSSTTPTVSRKPIIRIRHKSFNEFQSTTTPQPTESTILEALVLPTSTSQPATTIEPEVSPHLETVQTQEPEEVHTVEPVYLPPSERPPLPQSGVLYHLQREPELVSTPRPELQPYLDPGQTHTSPQLYPQGIQTSPQPYTEAIQTSPQPYPQAIQTSPQPYPQAIQTSPQPYPQEIQPLPQAYPQPGQVQPLPLPHLPSGQIRPVPQPYPQPGQIQAVPQHYLKHSQFQLSPSQYPQSFQIQSIAQPQVQTYLPASHTTPKPHSQPVFHNYQAPVFNLRPQYEPLPTPLPPQARLPQVQHATPPPRPDLQEQKQKPIKFKPKSTARPGETYLSPGTILTPIHPILQPHVYSHSQEIFFQPEHPNLSAPTYPTVQYFGKYAEAIFGHVRH